MLLQHFVTGVRRLHNFVNSNILATDVDIEDVNLAPRVENLDTSTVELAFDLFNG